MKRPLLLLVLLACAACSGQADDRADALPDTTGVDSVGMRAAALPDPDQPPATRGQLAVRSAGPIGYQGEWSARAGHCVAPPMLQVVVQEPLDGMILLLALPADDRMTDYPVTVVTQGLPEGPAAQAAVQRIIEGRPAGWQAHEGAVELYAWESGRVSGRFRLTMRDINTNEPSKLAGSFLGIEVVDLPPEHCQATDPSP